MYEINLLFAELNKVVVGGEITVGVIVLGELEKGEGVPIN